MSRSRTLSTVALVAVSMLVVASGAGAAAYSVTLKNGNTFETRYQPADVEWDPTVATIVTDLGNPIVLKKDEIAEVTSIAEAKGFGYQLNTTTLFLGWSPNDLLTTDAEGNQVPTYDTGADQPPPPPDYTIQQFVNVPTVGSPSTGGVPLSEVGITTD
jgi:hypothetical protein